VPVSVTLGAAVAREADVGQLPGVGDGKERESDYAEASRKRAESNRRPTLRQRHDQQHRSVVDRDAQPESAPPGWGRRGHSSHLSGNRVHEEEKSAA
jgi:hypothetical protein